MHWMWSSYPLRAQVCNLVGSEIELARNWTPTAKPRRSPSYSSFSCPSSPSLNYSSPEPPHGHCPCLLAPPCMNSDWNVDMFGGVVDGGGEEVREAVCHVGAGLQLRARLHRLGIWSRGTKGEKDQIVIGTHRRRRCSPRWWRDPIVCSAHGPHRRQRQWRRKGAVLEKDLVWQRSGRGGAIWSSSAVGKYGWRARRELQWRWFGDSEGSLKWSCNNWCISTLTQYKPWIFKVCGAPCNYGCTGTFSKIYIVGQYLIVKKEIYHK